MLREAKKEKDLLDGVFGDVISHQAKNPGTGLPGNLGEAILVKAIGSQKHREHKIAIRLVVPGNPGLGRHVE